MAIEAMKQALEDVSKSYDVLAFTGKAERVLGILEKTQKSLRTAIEQAEKQEAWQTSDTAYRPGGLPQDVQAEEPVAWVNLDQYGNLHESSSQTVPPDTFPVYRHPPAAQREPAFGYCKHCKQYTIEEPLPAAQREWVGLTDEEAMQTWGLVVKYAPSEVRLKSFARLIRDKLKEKNT